MPDTPSDNWRSPQTVIAMAGMAIVAGTVAAVFLRGDAATVNQTVGTVLGTLGGGIAGFYFGSSAGSQRKDTPPPPAAAPAPSADQAAATDRQTPVAA